MPKRSNRRADLLRSMPQRDPREDARAAFSGALYHLEQVKAQVAANLPNQKSVNVMHWHLRAFFWELVAVRVSLKSCGV
jgi:hypothetical protein